VFYAQTGDQLGLIAGLRVKQTQEAAQPAHVARAACASATTVIARRAAARLRGTKQSNLSRMAGIASGLRALKALRPLAMTTIAGHMLLTRHE